MDDCLKVATPSTVQFVQDMLAQQRVNEAIAGHSTRRARVLIGVANKMTETTGEPIHSVVGVIV